MKTDYSLLVISVVAVGYAIIEGLFDWIPTSLHVLLKVLLFTTVPLLLWFLIDQRTEAGKERKRKKEKRAEIPDFLLTPHRSSIHLGHETDLGVPIYLPDSIRSRHVHVLGSTGSGKTESVILNFLRQDVARGLGAIILDAKGDMSFLKSLERDVPKDRLHIFDLSSESSESYDPLLAGSPSESAQRLFSSLEWSEPYYKSKAFSALQLVFDRHHESKKRNPRISDIDHYLADLDIFNKLIQVDPTGKTWIEREFSEISGLRDQIRTLNTGHLEKILSPTAGGMDIKNAAKGSVLYFRLQSLLSPQVVKTVGRLLINHLNFLAGTAHRGDGLANEAKLVPTYLDEFASFACPEFADLISKARSAGLALHFAHQSIGDLVEVSPGFLSRITDNSATKIVMRINDPDTAEYFARTFGTIKYSKFTQRVTNTEDLRDAETIGEGSMREARQFRSSPDLFKTLPTGSAAILIAHGLDASSGGTVVSTVNFRKREFNA